MRRALTRAAAATGVPFAAWWGTWCVAALAGRRPVRRAERAVSPPAPSSRRVDVLVPAHDEERSLPALLGSLGLPGPAPCRGRVIVVADHCADGTADVARAMGAEVWVRDTGPRGKPAALREALERYRSEPGHGDALAFVDADCTCSPGMAAHLAAALERTPVVQAANVVRPGGDAASDGVALGMYLRNLLRPAGLDRLGMPVMLSGTGMAVRFDHLDRMRFDDDLAEDLKLSRILLGRGVRVGFAAAARVTSDSPPDRAALTAQRERWEGGSLRGMAQVPLTAARCAARGDLRGLVTLLDSSAPPLSLTVAGWGAATAVAGLGVALGLPRRTLVPHAVAGGALGLYLGVGAATAGGLREVAGLAARAPGFLAWKAGVYRGAARGGATTEWARTARAAGGADASEVR